MLDPDAPPKLRVLVVGSGYVAQHLIAHLKDDFDVAYSHRRPAPPFAVPGVQAVYLDLADDDAVATALHETLPDVVVNCAAVSSPKQCEDDEALAMSVNCPRGFLEALHACVPDVLLIHFSTDLVLQDSDTPYKDGGGGVGSASRCVAQTPQPTNAYGRSKLAFEKALVQGWDRCVVFRASNIAGPPAPYDGQGKFAQWVETQLRAKGAVDLWRDEVRSFISIRQVRDGVRACIEKHGVRHEPADDHEARALEAAAFSPSDDALPRPSARPPPAGLPALEFGRAGGALARPVRAGRRCGGGPGRGSRARRAPAGRHGAQGRRPGLVELRPGARCASGALGPGAAGGVLFLSL